MEFTYLSSNAFPNFPDQLIMINHFALPEFSPLQNVVYSFWETERANKTLLSETILPKGVIEIIFNFDTTIVIAQADQKKISVPRCFVQGFQTRPIHLSISGPQHSFGVVLYPTAVKHLLRSSPSEFSQAIIDLTLTVSAFNSLWHILAEQKSFKARVDAFTTWLIARLPEIPERETELNKFINHRSGSGSTVTALAKELCYSPRQLSRKILEITGMNTEQLLLYKKYLNAVELIHHTPMSMTEIAYSCHFSDQSHFTRTFKLLTQLTPKEYKARKNDIPGHLF